LFTLLENYYEKGSKYFTEDQNINVRLCEKLRRLYSGIRMTEYSVFKMENY
jgi:hypothetical protein